MDYTPAALLTDFMWASLLIFTAKFLREKLIFLQKMFIPVSVLSGFLGLALGPKLLNVIPFSGSISSYSGLLIIVVFVTLGLRGFDFDKGKQHKKGDTFRRLGAFYCFRNIGWAFQYSMPILFTVAVLRLIDSELPDAFGLMMAMGFQGGHGTSAAVGDTLAQLGWADATDLGMTVATITLLMSIVFGIIFIKIATKKGWTAYTPDFEKLPKELQTGKISEEMRESMGDNTISSNVLDSLCWHLALVLIPSGLGYILTQWISKVTKLGVPSFSVGFLLAIVFSYLLKAIKADKYVDKRIFNRISGTATDYLVFFGIVAINPYIVLKYIGPFLLMLLFGFAWTTFHFLVLAPHMMRKHWFERDVYAYGLSTGVTSISMCLLRIVDPDNKSGTLDDAAILTPVESIIEIFALAIFPTLLMTGKWYICVLTAGIYMLAMLIIPIATGWWYNGPKQSENRKDMF